MLIYYNNQGVLCCYKIIKKFLGTYENLYLFDIFEEVCLAKILILVYTSTKDSASNLEITLYICMYTV